MSLAMQMAKANTPLRVGPGLGQGDPGFWSDLKDRALGIIKGGVRGGPAGALAGAFRGGEGQQAPPPPVGRTGYPVQIQKPGIQAAFQRFLPFGETGLGEGCRKGFHANKSSYWLKDGTFVEKGSRCVRDRRRYNPANAGATSRSIGRINSAKRMQAKLATISTAKYTAAGKERACKL